MKAIVSKILGVSKSFIDFIWPLVTKQVAVSLATLLPIAYQIVKELAKNNNLNNSEKRQEAFNQLVNETKKQGLQAGDSLLNLAIEMAVNVLKGALK
jgi:hypothetical protein